MLRLNAPIVALLLVGGGCNADGNMASGGSTVGPAGTDGPGGPTSTSAVATSSSSGTPGSSDVSSDSSATGSSGGTGSSEEGTGGGPVPTVYFHSDWGTALGAEPQALLDDAWSECYGACADGMEVLDTAAEGRSFPSSRFLRISCRESSLGWANLRVAPDDSNVPEVGVGHSVFFRWYFRTLPGNLASLSADPLFHGTEFWADTSRPFGATDSWGAAGWRWSLDVSASPSGFEWQYGVGLAGEFSWDTVTGPLAHETVYRLEYGITRVSETEYEVHARIHDADGRRLFETEDFTLAAWSNQPSVNLLNDGPYTSDGTEWVNVQDWRLGLNGCNPPYEWGYAEYAAAAICDDWCGPYPIPGVED